jgi:tripartite-type tricarboxylate transporter receptor subunit TctC
VKHLLIVITVIASFPALAQNYPTRPVTLVVPAPAGGPTDIIGRQAAHVLTGQIWASPVSPDTFGKLMNLLEVSDGEKTVYGGVQD